MMIAHTRIVLAAATLLAACTSMPPYRTGTTEFSRGCEGIYREAHSDEASVSRDRIDAALATPRGHECWMRASERHEDFDLFTVEFDDQGWWAGETTWNEPGTRVRALTKYLDDQAKAMQPLDIVVYTHGWHHSAHPSDSNVIAFRRLLRGFAQLERRLCREARMNAGKSGDVCGTNDARLKYWEKSRRVVGIYVGWRGDSIDGAGIENLSIWDRKSTAEKVALGSAQELYALLHDYYIQHGCHAEKADSRCALRSDVRMLTIGHSFGGLITHRALAPRLMTAIVEMHRERDVGPLPYAYSYGDLAVLINPAFEGTRFEALARAAAQRPYADGSDPQRTAQLPILVIAQSVGDVATGTFFPLFRHATTVFEKEEGPQKDVNIKAVGWLERYMTHDLMLEAPDACPDWATDDPDPELRLRRHVEVEMAHISRLRKQGYAAFRKDLHLCDGLVAKPAQRRFAGTGVPPDTYSPLWVLKTSTDVIKNHNDFLNPRLQVFVRQLYQAILREKDEMQHDGIQKAVNACRQRQPQCDCESLVGTGSGASCQGGPHP